jgi:two-component system, OmpR family, sensor histidine kinase CiaH
VAVVNNRLYSSISHETETGKMNLSPRLALWLFTVMVVFQLAQTIWWVVFMNRLLNEQVEMAIQLDGTAGIVESIQQQGIDRQIMVGLEGAFFLIVFATGIWFMYRALVRSDELKFHQQNFLMAVTHEFKTPIASMRIYLDTLRSPKVSVDKKQEIVPRLGEDVKRLEKLVENVLHAARFERHGYRLIKEQFNLSNLIRDRIAAIERIPTTLPKSFTADIQDGVDILGDAPALGRAIDAILENSLSYHSDNPIEIAVSLRISDSKATISITDNGIGIKKGDIPRLFERFFRVGDELTRHSAGTGLGLYLCREIIKAHGGTVRAQSEGLGKGATFTITLRLAVLHENRTSR